MPEAGNSRLNWSHLLADIRQLLASYHCTTIPDETKFHELFLQLCERAGEKDPQRVLGKFLRHHDPIIVFADQLDDALGWREPPNNLKSQIFSIVYSTAESALKFDNKREIFRKVLPKLEGALPKFGPDLGQFQEDTEVQKPLQTVFKEYIDCYINMLLQFSTQPDPPSLEGFSTRIESASRVFKEKKEDWENLLQVAKDKQFATMHSIANGTGGPLYSPNMHFSFETIDELGQGNFGKVTKVRMKGTSQTYAQKIIQIKDPQNRAQLEKSFDKEVSIMQRLRHPHIAAVNFYCKDEDHLCMFMLPVADYDLLKFLMWKGSAANNSPQDQSLLTRNDITHLTNWFGCLVRALDFAHRQSVTHGDIKPQNILIKGYQPFLSDFGSAKEFNPLEGSRSGEWLVWGTPVYWAPEGPGGRPGDVFALGCVFSEMLTVRQGFSLEQYRNARFVPHDTQGYAFRQNLKVVRKWVESLQQDRKDPVAFLLVEQTLLMFNEQESRPDATRIRKSLRQEWETVFCSSCD